MRLTAAERAAIRDSYWRVSFDGTSVHILLADLDAADAEIAELKWRMKTLVSALQDVIATPDQIEVLSAALNAATPKENE